MRFYKLGIHIAKSLAALLTPQQLQRFLQTPTSQLTEYQQSLGMWIRNHILPHNTYLCEALSLLGMASSDEKSLYLIEFAQHYLILERADMQ